MLCVSEKRSPAGSPAFAAAHTKTAAQRLHGEAIGNRKKAVISAVPPATSSSDPTLSSTANEKSRVLVSV